MIIKGRSGLGFWTYQQYNYKQALYAIQFLHLLYTLFVKQGPISANTLAAEHAIFRGNILLDVTA